MNGLAVDISSLDFSWPGRPSLLLIDQLRIARGERTFLHGPSGSGKSTLLSLMALGLGVDLANRPATALSIGQQQRVAAARALIGRPALVIADEPTSALDSDTRAGFLDLLMNECRAAGTTLLFVSHDLSLASLFDRSVALRELNRAAGSGA